MKMKALNIALSAPVLCVVNKLIVKTQLKSHHESTFKKLLVSIYINISNIIFEICNIISYLKNIYIKKMFEICIYFSVKIRVGHLFVNYDSLYTCINKYKCKLCFNNLSIMNNL